MSLKQFLIANPNIKKFWLSSMEMCCECSSDDEEILEMFGDRKVLNVKNGKVIMICII